MSSGVAAEAPTVTREIMTTLTVDPKSLDQLLEHPCIGFAKAMLEKEGGFRAVRCNTRIGWKVDRRGRVRR